MSTPNRAPHADPPADDATFGADLVALTPRLRAFVRRLCLRESDDLVQEALARAWRSRAAFRREHGGLDGWLMKIAFRTYLDHRARPVSVALGDDAASVEARREVLAELHDDLSAAMLQLSAIERDVLLRFHRDRQSIDEIARATSMPVGTVKSHLHRGRMRLVRESEA